MIGATEPATRLAVLVALLAVGGGAVARSVFLPSRWHISPGLCIALAGAVTLVYCMRARRRPQPWAAASLRLAASALLGAITPDSLPALPLLPSTAYTLASTRALWLLALATVLPLPLRHHLWVQALSLCAALSRLPAAAALHVLQAGQAEQCCSFVSAARAAMPALVPGAIPAPRPSPPGHRCCWMLHAWAATLFGYGLPTAVHAALWSHARWRCQWQQGGMPQEAGEQAGQASPTPQEAGEQAGQASSTQRAQEQPPTDSSAGPSSGGGAHDAAQPEAGASVPQAAAEASQADQAPASGGQAAATRRPGHEREPQPGLRRQQLLGAALLAGSLCQSLLLLVQAGALVWAGLELVESF